MATVPGQYLPRIIVILGGILTLLWGLALGWITLPWLFAGLLALAGLLEP